jgi:hypothetical protein
LAITIAIRSRSNGSVSSRVIVWWRNDSVGATLQPIVSHNSVAVLVTEPSIVQCPTRQLLMERGRPSSRFGWVNSSLTCQYVKGSDIVKTHRIDLVTGHCRHAAPELDFADLLNEEVHTGSNPRIDLNQHHHQNLRQHSGPMNSVSQIEAGEMGLSLDVLRSISTQLAGALEIRRIALR